MAEPMTFAQTVRDIVRCHGGLPTRLLQILREVQDHLTWLPAEALEQVAEELGLSPDKVRGNRK